MTRRLNVVDPCTLADAQEYTCHTKSAAYISSNACSLNGFCGERSSALGASIILSTVSGPGAYPIETTAAATAATAATILPDKTLPMIIILGQGEAFVTNDGNSMGMITTVLVGSTYIDDGAIAIKIPRY